MAVSEFLEDLVSHLPALHLLQQVGHEYLTPCETMSLRGDRRSRVILKPILFEQLRKLNQITFKGQTHDFTETNLNNAIDALMDIPFDGLVKTNERAFDLLTLGKAEEQTIDGNKRSYTIQYLDWENPENNVYHITDEFEVERTASHELRRPDIVLFVNGIPFSVIECKRPDDTDAVEVGISQHLRNQRLNEVPGLFVYSQLLGSICQNDGKFATTGTARKFWSGWKEEHDDNLDVKLAKLINTPLTSMQLNRMFDSRKPAVVAKMKELLASGQRLPSPQDRLLYCLFRPERLLEMTYRYTVFDKNVKKVARYQQYFAIGETIARVTNSKGDEQRPGGVIWHTTGSGKSLTMVMLAKALSLETSIKNPRVVIVTDRVNLDRQIWKTFIACRKTVERAKSGSHLVDLVSNGKADIITTIIDKFESAATTHDLRDEGNNIFVLVDESHRSQYGLAHAKMKQVFPKACFIGFTGTPLLKKEKSTATKFGGFIHSYPMRQAVEDKAVTPILYEGRMSELHGDQKAIDKWFDRITKDLSAEQKADLKKKFRREEELTKTSERLYEIAFDLVTHFCENFKGTKFKGQFAVSSKAMALKYHQLFEQIGKAYPERRLSSRVIISPPDTREDNETIEEDDVPEIQKFWKQMMDQFGSEKKYLERTIEDFEKKPEPEIIICVDKLLTGFDAPCNTVLYIDKRLRDHNILQAIARVNRLFDGKDFGLVIDYRGIFGALDAAVKKYDALSGFDEEDLEGTFTNVDEEVAKLKERHTNVWSVFSAVQNKQDLEAMQQWLRPDDVRQDFYDALNEFSKTLQLAMSSAKFHEDTSKSTVQRYVDDMKYFRNLRAAVKQRYNEAVDYNEYEDQIRNMVDKYIGADEVKQIVEPVNIFEVDNLDEELAGIEGAAAKADYIASRVKKTCVEKMEEDPVLYQKLSEVIDEAIQEYLEKRLSEEAYLQKMFDAWNEAKNQGSSNVPPELRSDPEAKAYFRLFLDGFETVTARSAQVQEAKADYDADDGQNPRDVVAGIAAETALKAKKLIDEHKIRDWTENRDVENAMINDLDDLMFAVKGRYDLQLTGDDIDEMIEGVIRVAKRRENRR
ncbi:Type I restriction enzyme [Symmachiella macrocystis]|uniref:Type I restriction enzyme endonuclease subunit n=1 Tax=Symmachiella macrocystis TaxID=2527985 RepID=A0A5C6BA90_9PLAN|nr:HsdR family type I site-specific deoxyribonuclease [Symmachiella macrocystis]TWU08888.1 Type I restriction enzyme [Symmachiella macrocystis]